MLPDFQTGDGSLFRRLGSDTSDRGADGASGGPVLQIHGGIQSPGGERVARFWTQDGGQKRSCFLVSPKFTLDLLLVFC